MANDLVNRLLASAQQGLYVFCLTIQGDHSLAVISQLVSKTVPEVFQCPALHARGGNFDNSALNIGPPLTALKNNFDLGKAADHEPEVFCLFFRHHTHVNFGRDEHCLLRRLLCVGWLGCG